MDSEADSRLRMFGCGGPALFGAMCAAPFLLRMALTPDWKWLGGAVLAFAGGSAWLLAVMGLNTWLVTKPTWPLPFRRALLVGAVMVGPIGARVLLQL